MEKISTILAIVIALASAFVWGWCAGGRRAGSSGETLTATDTVWVETHDTLWREVAVSVLRTDTVKLATVSILERADTITVHDSVYVEVPIETHTFLGDHYRITAHGYRVGLDDVWFDRQVIMAKTTETRYADKRWRFNVGAQIGYGYTVHGASPYAGIGVAFGYTF